MLAGGAVLLAAVAATFGSRRGWALLGLAAEDDDEPLDALALVVG